MPKRRIPISVVLVAIGLVVLDVVKGVVSNRVDAYLVEHPGILARMWNVVDWAYTPHLVALVGIVGLWWWSQGSPTERFVEKEVYRDPPPAPAPPPPIRVPLGDISWEERPSDSYLHGPRPAGFCKQHPHQELRFRNRYGNGVSRTERILDRYPDRAAQSVLWCVEGDHGVSDGPQGYFEEQQRAQALIESERRRRRAEQQQQLGR